MVDFSESLDNCNASRDRLLNQMLSILKPRIFANQDVEHGCCELYGNMLDTGIHKVGEEEQLLFTLWDQSLDCFCRFNHLCAQYVPMKGIRELPKENTGCVFKVLTSVSMSEILKVKLLQRRKVGLERR